NVNYLRCHIQGISGVDTYRRQAIVTAILCKCSKSQVKRCRRKTNSLVLRKFIYILLITAHCLMLSSSSTRLVASFLALRIVTSSAYLNRSLIWERGFKSEIIRLKVLD